MSDEFKGVLFSALASAFGSGILVGFMAGPIVATAAVICGMLLVFMGYGLHKFNEYRERKLLARMRQELLEEKFQMDLASKRIREKERVGQAG